MFASRVCWYLIESILPYEMFPVLLAATQAQSMIDPPPCLTVGEVFFSWKSAPFFHTSFAHCDYFNFITPQDLFPKCIRVVSLFLCKLLHFVARTQERFSFDDTSIKVIFVQVFLHSRTEHHHFRIKLNLPVGLLQSNGGFSSLAVLWAVLCTLSWSST